MLRLLYAFCGQDVETFMLNNNYTEKEKFVQVIRNCFEAEDSTGISVDYCCIRRLKLRQYLLERLTLNFCSFPYKTQNTGGIPVVTFEVLLEHLEKSCKFIDICKQNVYKPRAFGIQSEVEQFSAHCETWILLDLELGQSLKIYHRWSPKQPSKITYALTYLCWY